MKLAVVVYLVVAE